MITDDMLLNENLKQLRLPTMKCEYGKLAKEALQKGAGYEDYLLLLSECELAERQSKAIERRIKAARFVSVKDFDSYDFSAVPSLSKQSMLQLSRCEWISKRENACLIGSPGTGKTHLAVALGLSACRKRLNVRFVTAASLVSQLEEAQANYQLEKLCKKLDKADLLIIDELGYLTFAKSGADLLFRLFADRYEKGSILVTSNLAFADWVHVFKDDRMTAALLDRFTHRCNIFEMNGESYRFRQSVKAKNNIGKKSTKLKKERK